MVMDKCTMEIPPADYEWKDTEMDPMAIMQAAGQKTVALADEAARKPWMHKRESLLQVQQEICGRRHWHRRIGVAAP